MKVVEEDDDGPAFGQEVRRPSDRAVLPVVRTHKASHPHMTCTSSEPEPPTRPTSVGEDATIVAQSIARNRPRPQPTEGVVREPRLRTGTLEL